MSDIAVLTLVLALSMLFFAYVGFPLLVIAVGLLRRRAVAKAAVAPRMSLIIAAYNEEDCIAERLENALAADYPADALEVIVASDGSTDRTADIVATYAMRGVRLLRLPRRGKIHALTDAVHAACGDVLVFSDANTAVHPDALRALAANFADPTVGGVVGHTGYRVRPGSESSSRGEDSYWRYDTWIKELESRSGSVVSAHGGLYALRRELFQAPADAAVTDDFFISTGVVAQGYRLVFEPAARAWEYAVPAATREFSRRVRLMTRGLRALALRRALLNPFRYGFYSVVLFSHKLLRRLVPVVLPPLFVATLALSARHPFYAALLAGQVGILLFALAGWLLRRSPLGHMRLLYLPYFYCMANLAALIALLRFVRGDRIALWQPQRHELQAEPR